MLKLGEKIINQIYLGDKKIAKAYLGDKLVYQADKPIFVEYIEFTGTQCIDTGISHEKGKYGKWVVTSKSTNVSKLKMLLGNGGTGIQFFACNSKGKWGFGENIYFDINADTKITADIVFEDTQVTATIDDESIVRTGTISTHGNFILGNFALVKNQYNFNGYVYGCSYIDVDGNLALDLKPCIDPKGVVCMYDMVTKKYLYNAGTGEFIAGGRFVDYIESTGTQYIDTGIKTSACRVEIVAECTTLPNISGYQQLFSKNYDYAGCAIFACNPNWGVRDVIQTNTPSNKKSTIIADFSLENTFPKVVMTVDGVTVEYARTSLPSSANHNWSLMSAPNRSFGLKGRVYSCKMYDLENNLLRDLRPALDANGVVCMYDMVTKKYFYNAGTGTFGYTEE